jgi:hypothetical protein
MNKNLKGHRTFYTSYGKITLKYFNGIMKQHIKTIKIGIYIDDVYVDSIENNINIFSMSADTVVEILKHYNLIK